MDQFTFTDKSKKIFIGLMIVGVLSLIYGIFTDHHHGQRVWASALINGWFFFGIGLCATFFIAVNNAAQAAWGVVLKRIFEAVSMFMPYGTALMLIVLIGSALHLNHLYHWMDASLLHQFMIEGADGTVQYVDSAEGAVKNPHFDQLIANKTPYLNVPFWLGRAIVFLAVWTIFAFIFRKKSLQEDMEGGTHVYKKSITLSAIFLVFFGYTSVVASWDWLMSIDPHWFSTLYGWYIFSGMWISGMVMVLLLTFYLKSKGYLSVVNPHHIHDMGKWVFGVSFLWTYLFFSQFMLIWYSDIPEEVTYFLVRIEDYTVPFWLMVGINFIVPMLLLMSKETKKNSKLLSIVGVIVFLGHWADVYFIVTPGTMKDAGTIGITEIGMMLGYLGLFLFVVFNQLAKAPLVVKNHPMLDESIHHTQI